MRYPLVVAVAASVVACSPRHTLNEDQPSAGEISLPRADTGFAAVPGGRLYYEAWGSGDPVVLIHGNAGDRRHWDLQVEALARRYRVVRYDVRGFGRSSLPVEEQPYSHHEDLLALLDHLRIRTAHLVGWSMGSGIAVDFVLAHPDRSASLVSLGPWANGYGSPAVRDMLNDFSAVRTAMSQGGRSSALDAWMNAPFFRSTIRVESAGDRFRRIARDFSFWSFAHRDPQRTLTPAAARRMSEIHVPTLVVTAEHDIPACREVGDSLARSVANARKVDMSGTGHLMHMEKPEEFNDLLLAFLGAAAR